jgi:hypothetical protein
LTKATARLSGLGGAKFNELWQLAQEVDYDRHPRVVKEKVALAVQRINDLAN